MDNLNNNALLFSPNGTAVLLLKDINAALAVSAPEPTRSFSWCSLFSGISSNKSKTTNMTLWKRLWIMTSSLTLVGAVVAYWLASFILDIQVLEQGAASSLLGFR
jgi:hypothetical protein